MESYRSDVVIVGAGLAGITAAFELLNQGKKVLLLDRDVREQMGGLAKKSFGGMFFVNTPQQRLSGIRDTPEQAWRDWQSVAEFEEGDRYPRQWAESYVYNCTDQVYNWITKLGVTFFPAMHWVERGMYKPGNSVPRFHMVWGTGHALSNVMEGQLLNHPKASSLLTLKFEHKVDEVLTQNGRVTGVRGITENTKEPFEAYGDVTIIAAGGMGGNIERVKQNWHKPWGAPPEVLLNGSHRYADGTMHDAVAKIDGHITHLDKNWPYAAGVHHQRPKIKDHGLSLVPPKSALWLDYTGARIGPMPLITAYDTRFLVEQICKQKKKYSWQVMNLRIAHREFAISGAESNEAIRDKKWIKFISTILFGNKDLVKDMIDNCPDFVIANSIEELAEKMNKLQGTNDVDVKNMKEAITDYDANIDRGFRYMNDEQLRRIAHTRQYIGDKLRTCKFQKIYDKSAMPLIAIREFILSRKTLGGMQTDMDSRVLSTPDLSGQQHPIEGLYAVGEAAGFGGGGMHGIGSLEGTFLGGCVYTGRIAAQHIAGRKLM